MMPLFRNVAPELAADVAWLYERARQCVDGVRREANGLVYYTPGGGYGCFFMRDFCYVVEGMPEMVGADQLKTIIRFILRFQRADGGMPTMINPENGSARYCTEGDNTRFTDTDNNPMLVNLVQYYLELSGDWAFAAEVLPALVRAMNQTPRDEHGLVWIDPQSPHTGYGFTDQVFKTGCEMFSSVLYWDACRHLVEIARRASHAQEVEEFQRRGDRIVANIGLLWNEKEKAFNATSLSDPKVDVWANALLSYLDMPVGDRLPRVREFLLRCYGDYCWRGQVRHLLAGQFWTKTLYREIMSGGYRRPDGLPVTREDMPWMWDGKYMDGYYQHGAYWGLPSGWVLWSLAQLDPPRAVAMLRDVIRDFRENGVDEYITADYRKGPSGYVASITPLVGAVKRLLDIPFGQPLIVPNAGCARKKNLLLRRIRLWRKPLISRIIWI